MIRKTSFLIVLLCFTATAYSYAVLTHEAIIDESWNNTIQPYLLKIYPNNNSVEDLTRAKAFAYGGAALPDIGYFPFGSKRFTNLIHYVRGGDFIEFLIKDSRDINELAFSLGMLSHYMGDNYGHSTGINPSLPIMYPKLKKKFGDTITYEDNPKAHKRMEFTFDILQVSRGKYAPNQYHQFMGFEVPEDLLQRAFIYTYGLQLHEVFTDLNLSLATYRWFILKGFPLLTKSAWKAKKKKAKHADETINQDVELYKLDKKVFERNWQKNKKKGVGSTLLSLLIKITPKIGPLKPLSFKEPTKEVELNFIKSFEQVKKSYQEEVIYLMKNSSDLKNTDFDTGKQSILGEYCLSDKTYFKWLYKLHSTRFKNINKELQENIITYYKNHPSPSNKKLKTYMEELNQIKFQ